MGGKKRTGTLSERWRDGGRVYCAAINKFVSIGETDGWDAAGDEPQDGRTAEEVAAVLDIVRKSQGSARAATLRERFPPGWAVLATKATAVDRWIGPSFPGTHSSGSL